MQSVQQQQAPVSSSVVQSAAGVGGTTGLAGVAPPVATTQQGTRVIDILKKVKILRTIFSTKSQ